MTRLQALEALLAGWLDYHPWPNGSVAFRGAGSGPAPSRVEQCPDCDGRGKRHGGARCESCAGRGRRSVDAYTGLQVADSDVPMRVLLDTWTVCSRCAGDDRQCSRCHGSGRERALLSGKLRAEVDGVQRSRSGDRTVDALADGARLRQRSTSGRQIESGMVRLRSLDPVGHGVIVWCLVLGQVPVRALSARERVALVGGLVRLSSLIVGPIVVPAELVRADRERRLAAAAVRGRRLSGSARSRRDAAIRELYALGSWSQEALAVRFGVDQATVSRACRRESDTVSV